MKKAKAGALSSAAAKSSGKPGRTPMLAGSIYSTQSQDKFELFDYSNRHNFLRREGQSPLLNTKPKLAPGLKGLNHCDSLIMKVMKMKNQQHQHLQLQQ